MKSYLDLIPISAKVHKKQSRMTKVCIVLAVFLVTAIFSMADMEIRSQQLQAIKGYGNWHAIFTDIDEEEGAMIAARPEVNVSGWYGYVGEKAKYTVSGKPVSVAGVDNAVFESIFPTKLKEGVYPTKKEEVVLSQNAKIALAINVGDTIALEHSGVEPVRLTVVGFMEATSKMLSQDSYTLLLTTEGFRTTMPKDLYKSQFMVQLSRYCNMQKVISGITQKYQLTTKQVAQNTALLGMIGQSKDNYMLALYSTAAVLFVVVLLAGILMIASSLNSNVAQRTEFFGMMRCLGSTKKQIMRFVRLEGLQWCKSAIPIGISMGMVVVWILCAILKVLSPGYFAEMPTLGVSLIGICSGIAVGILTVLLAAKSPAKKAARVSPLTAVSGNTNSIQTTRAAADTNLFKVDISLGIHHAVASKKNFLLMVASYALSIVLFLCFSTAVDFMHHAVKPLKPWTPDLSIISSNNTCSIDRKRMETLQDNPHVKQAYGRMFAYDVPIKIDGQDKVINLISYEEHQFSWAKKYLIEGSINDVIERNNKVLVVYDSATNLHVGDTFSLNCETGQKEVTVAGLLSSSPFDREKGVETVICSEETFQQLTGKRDYTIIDIKLSNSATEEDVNVIRSLAGSNTRFSDRRVGNHEARGAFYSMALFIYGFLVIIAMITIFNIVNSVSMSVSARMKQYGAMRAIGMSDHQLVKMVAAEAVTYSVIGSLVGCILGLPLHNFLFEQMITSHWGDLWYLPLGPLGVIVAIVLITSILAVHNPAKRIHNLSIVDTISAQ